MSILVWSHIGGLLVSTPYLLLKADIHTIPVAYWPFFGILAVLILVALTSFYKAVQTSPISLISPIVSAHLVVVILIPSQKGLFEMNPGVRRGLEGRRPRDAGCWAHRTICRAQDKRDPVAVPLPWLRAPGGSCGAAPS